MTDDIEPKTGWPIIRNKTLPDGREWKPKTKASVRDVWLPPWLMQRLQALLLPRKPFVWPRHLVNIDRAFHDQFDPKRFVPFVQHQITACCDALGIPRFSVVGHFAGSAAILAEKMRARRPRSDQSIPLPEFERGEIAASHVG